MIKECKRSTPKKYNTSDYYDCLTYIRNEVDKGINERISVRLLFGGPKSDWHGTSLQKIYDSYISTGLNHENAKKKSAIDVGWLLKKVLMEHPKRFIRVGKDSGNVYECVISKS